MFKWIVFFLPFSLFSGSTSQTFNVTLPYTSAMDLKVSTNNISFPTAVADDLTAGFIDQLNALVFTICSNTPYRLTVETIEASMGGSGPKAITDLQGKLSTGSNFVSLSQTPIQVRQSSQNADNLSFSADLRILTGWTKDPPGTYSATLLFTLGSSV